MYACDVYVRFMELPASSDGDKWYWSKMAALLRPWCFGSKFHIRDIGTFQIFDDWWLCLWAWWGSRDGPSSNHKISLIAEHLVTNLDYSACGVVIFWMPSLLKFYPSGHLETTARAWKAISTRWASQFAIDFVLQDTLTSVVTAMLAPTARIMHLRCKVRSKL